MEAEENGEDEQEEGEDEFEEVLDGDKEDEENGKLGSEMKRKKSLQLL